MLSSLAKLDGDNLMVYSAIESAATTGIWTKTLKARTNLHQTAMTKALKILESAKYVKPIKSVKFPGRKLYMLYDLNPAEEVTGGSWFSDGELDIDFVENLGDVIVALVKKHSWREGPKMPKSAKEVTRATTGKVTGKVTNGAASATNEDTMDIEMTTDFTSFNLAVSARDRILIPHPPGYKDYPTATSILDMVYSIGILQGKDLELPDLIHLLDALVFDARLERVGRRAAKLTDEDADLPDVDIDADEDAETEVPTRETRIGPIEEDMYRWVRTPFNEGPNGPGNGWSEAPCSRCPVFRLCEEGGPVDARNCGYFEQWLAV